MKKGNRSGLSLTHIAWEEIGNKFKIRTSTSLTRDKFKNKWDEMRKKYKEWVNLKSMSGLGWSIKRNIVVASNEWWEEYIQVRKIS